MPRRRNALVAFFEFRDPKGEPIDGLIDWPGLLREIKQESIEARRHVVNGAYHWGQVFTHRGTDHLVLARMRDGVSSFNTTTGEIFDTESDATTPWVEVSVVHFLPDTNRFGFVLGSNAAPHVSSLYNWMNAHRLFGEQITVAPVLDREVLAKIQGAAAASLVKVSFTPDQLESSQGLFGFAKGLRERYGDVEIDLQLKVTRNHGGRHERETILNEARSLATSDDFKKAVARLISIDEHGKQHSEDVDFLNHRLAKRMKIQLTDREGKSIRVASALEAIYRAADQLKRDLYGI